MDTNKFGVFVRGRCVHVFNSMPSVDDLHSVGINAGGSTIRRIETVEIHKRKVAQFNPVDVRLDGKLVGRAHTLAQLKFLAETFGVGVMKFVVTPV